MDTFTQALQITVIGMVLVFLSLVLVAVLIWALGKIFRPKEEAAAAPAVRPRPAPVTAEAAAAPRAGSGTALADQAAALAVALVLGRQRAGQGAYVARSSARAPMPWERAVLEEDVPQGEIVTIIAVNPGPSNWKSQARLKAME